MGKCWRDGLGVYPDDEKAELWFRRSAETGNEFSQYALGKLLQSEKRIEEAVSWYQKAAAQGSQYANYQLGKLYLQGEGVPKDVDMAIDYLTRSAESGNQYAQYILGKLYLPQDRETARYWFSESAAQGNEYAQFFLDRWGDRKRPAVMLSVTRLLQHMGEIFRDNSVPPQAPAGQQADRQLRLKIREKKIAMGHRPDDHEEQGYTGPAL